MTAIKSTRLQRPLVGIGSCLAGNAVRYNGEANTPNRHVREICAHFDVQAFCPEMGIGLGVPRAPIHLMGNKDSVRVVDVETHRLDYTDAIRSYARHVLDETPLLCGYILVKGSPSCGYGGVKRYSPAGEYLAADQDGIFAAALADADPLLPLADDGNLNGPELQESFSARVCAYHTWKSLTRRGLTRQCLIEFYSRYEGLVVSQHASRYKKLGALLADAEEQSLDTLASEFISTLMAALSSDDTLYR